jgi:DNA modification methylase
MQVEIKTVKLSEIKLNPDNPRRISEKDMDRLVKSLTEFPDMMQIREIVVDETMTVLGGNMRTLALRKSGAKECTAKIVKGLTPEQKREFVIKDNSAFGEWDMDLLSGWDDLPLVEWGLDLPEDWLKPIETGEPADAPPQIDKAEELNKVWKVKSGDIWQIGDHRLLCGDSTKKEDVGRVMGEEKADMVLTDPPYGMKLDTDYSGLTSKKSFGKGKTHKKVEGDDRPFDAAIIAGCDCKEQFWFGADYYAHTLGDTEQTGSWMVWDKRLDDSADKMYGSCFELVWSKQKHKRDMLRHKWAGFFTDGEERSYLHPTEKPVSLLVELINRGGDAVIIYDPFLGSGTTMVACQNLNRKCRGIEISEDYCAVILQRMTDAFPDIEIKKI